MAETKDSLNWDDSLFACQGLLGKEPSAKEEFWICSGSGRLNLP
jgi:hypothetical protein